MRVTRARSLQALPWLGFAGLWASYELSAGLVRTAIGIVWFGFTVVVWSAIGVAGVSAMVQRRRQPRGQWARNNAYNRAQRRAREQAEWDATPKAYLDAQGNRISPRG